MLSLTGGWNGVDGTCYFQNPNLNNAIYRDGTSIGNFSYFNILWKCKIECREPKNGPQYPVVGVQGEACFCGNDAALKRAIIAPQRDCNMRCPGNPTAFCGGANRISFYHSSSAKFSPQFSSISKTGKI